MPAVTQNPKWDANILEPLLLSDLRLRRLSGKYPRYSSFNRLLTAGESHGLGIGGHCRWMPAPGYLALDVSDFGQRDLDRRKTST